MTEIAIPYGAYWSTPFARWQGSLAHLHSLRFAAHVAKAALRHRNIEPDVFDAGVLGMSIPQRNSFYGLPWLMGEIGAASVAGPTISQACATSARVLQTAASEIREGAATVSLAVTADRISNGPQIYYPAPQGPGGSGEHESMVLESFERDPFAGVAMIQTAENVAAEHGIDTAMQNELTLCRYEQYKDACKNDSAFLRTFMELPFEVPDARFRRTQGVLEGDEGIFPTTAEKLAALKPVLPGGTVTYGGQTHPADGNAGMVLTTPDRAADFSRDKSIDVRLVAFGQARVKKAFMPAAPVPAARRALEAAGLDISQIAAIKTHNPFIVNDIVLAKSFGIDAKRINQYGCSLVWGHPQGPTGLRAIIELIEQLVLEGGGYGLFVGCAAGDSAMAAIVKVDSRKA